MQPDEVITIPPQRCRTLPQLVHHLEIHQSLPQLVVHQLKLQFELHQLRPQSQLPHGALPHIQTAPFAFQKQTAASVKTKPPTGQASYFLLADPSLAGAITPSV